MLQQLQDNKLNKLCVWMYGKPHKIYNSIIIMFLYTVQQNHSNMN